MPTPGSPKTRVTEPANNPPPSTRSTSAMPVGWAATVGIDRSQRHGLTGKRRTERPARGFDRARHRLHGVPRPAGRTTANPALTGRPTPAADLGRHGLGHGPHHRERLYYRTGLPGRRRPLLEARTTRGRTDSCRSNTKPTHRGNLKWPAGQSPTRGHQHNDLVAAHRHRFVIAPTARSMVSDPGHRHIATSRRGWFHRPVGILDAASFFAMALKPPIIGGRNRIALRGRF